MDKHWRYGHSSGRQAADMSIMKIPKTTSVGSDRYATQPMLGMGRFSTSTVAPASLAFMTASSMSSTPDGVDDLLSTRRGGNADAAVDAHLLIRACCDEPVGPFAELLPRPTEDLLIELEGLLWLVHIVLEVYVPSHSGTSF